VALSFLKTKSIIHKDVRSDNILMSTDGRARLSGFDFCVKVDTYAQDELITGTPLWLAPEILKKELYDHKADIWSMGIMVIEMVRGKPPFYGLPPYQAIAAIVETATSCIMNGDDIGVSKWTSQLLGFCLQADPGKRPSAEALLLVS
jgi:serine/threonine protein kinase